MLKVSYFYTGNLPNSSLQACMFCLLKLKYGPSVVKHGESSDFCATLYMCIHIAQPSACFFLHSTENYVNVVTYFLNN